MSFRVTDYGFVWDQVTVERIHASDDGSKYLTVNGLEIYVSAKGKSVRVFRGGKELL